tara:strand:- start:957 stop:4244 length:3288 start_codon:yes stop_codon:yes gene_type:complete
MALVSPGIEISVTDESQYVPGAVGTVPLVMLATAQDKSNPSGTSASDTTKARAGKLLTFTSQRELIAAMGYPSFQQSAAGTPLHGDERNEYGLLAAHSALGIVNRVFAIRADIDLDELTPTAVRPTGVPVNGTHWLDLSASVWGIYSWNATTNALTNNIPLLITSTTDQTLVSSIYVPKASIGQIGQYAVSFGTGSNANLFLKAGGDLPADDAKYNTWVRLGTDDWATSVATIKGSVTSPVILASSPAATVTINGSTVTVGNTGANRTLDQVVSSINTAAVTGVTAANVGNKLFLYASSLAESDGATADGKIAIANGSGTPLATLGITAGTYANPLLLYGDFAAYPSWRSTDTVPRPSGSVFAKLGATGSGADLVIKKYSTLTDTFTTQAAPFYSRAENALFKLDPAGGGAGIAAGSLWVAYDPLRTGTGGYKPFNRRVAGQTIVSGTATAANPFTATEQLKIGVTSIGSATITEYTVTLSGTSPASFVSDILALNIPELDISVSSTNVIKFTHIYGGDIYLTDVSGTPTADAGFSSSTTGTILYANSVLALTNWEALTYTYSIAEPYQAPADGTLWYYSDAATVDIMIADVGGWKGYKSSYYDGSTTDARGFDLSLTDPLGVQVAASEPTFQADGVSALVAGDLWLDSSDLENYPKLYRYSGTAWVLIDNTDQTSQNGILFADARWDTDGTTDIITGSLPAITDLLASDYIDQDAPDYRLFPRGTLLWNMRRSGYNIKQYVSDKFNATAFPDLPAVPGAGSVLPTVKNTWQTQSGLQSDGSMFAGRKAQRQVVVAAMQSALTANTEVREDQYSFNLIVSPGYPELIAQMVALNSDRKETAFVIGDTPLRLAPDAASIGDYSNNTLGTGSTSSTASPYLGVYYPAGQTIDLQGNTVTVPSSHAALRTIIKNDNVAYQWFAPAGTRRGLVDNISTIGYIDEATGEFQNNSIRVGLRDTLYENKINPITNLPGIGLVVWGQKTRNPSTSSLDRINVARLVNYLRTILARVGDGFLFEPNDKITRDQISNVISGAINDLVAKRGVFDYLVVCDDTNNTPTRIARNELYVDIAIEPMKTVEFIFIPIRLKNPGDIAEGL